MLGLLLLLAVDSTAVDSAFVRDPCDCVRSVKWDTVDAYISISQFYPSRKTAQMKAEMWSNEAPVWHYKYNAVRVDSYGWKFKCKKRWYEVTISTRGKLVGEDEGGWVVLKFYRL